MWQLKKLNAALANPKLNTENDAEEYGKGHEFATQTFKTSWDVAGTLEKYLSAEIAAWAMAFGLGKVVKSRHDAQFHLHLHAARSRPTATPSNCPTSASSSRSARARASVLDRMAVGCAVEGWTITVGSGPGPRQQQDQHRVRRLGQAHRAVRDHAAGRDARRSCCRPRR